MTHIFRYTVAVVCLNQLAANGLSDLDQTCLSFGFDFESNRCCCALQSFCMASLVSQADKRKLFNGFFTY